MNNIFKSDNELIFEQYNKNIVQLLNEHVFELHPNDKSVLKFSIDYDKVNEPTRKYAEILEQNPKEVNKYLSDNFKYLIYIHDMFYASHNTPDLTDTYYYIPSFQMIVPEPITSLDKTNESGVFLNIDGDYNIWWVNDLDTVCKYLHDLLLKYCCSWDISNSANLDEDVYDSYKNGIYTSLQEIGLSRSKITAALHNNIHKQFGISDDEYSNLFGDDI